MQNRLESTDLPTTRPCDVPFVGWSRAAHEFRGQVAQLAPGGGVRPLIIGDPGVGKRTMARAWQVVAGKAGDDRIEDLDYRSIGLPTCYIGVTTFRPPLGRSAILLGGDARGEVPRGVEQSAGAPELEDEIARLFDLALYMPPLADGRQIDILAFLDYWNRARSPFVGIRYARVSLRWLRGLVLQGPWAANLEGVYRQIRLLNQLNRPPIAGSDEVPIIHEVGTLRERSKRPTSAEGLRPGGGDDPGAAPEPDEEEIPFGAIPDLAVRTYLWCCRGASSGEPGPGRTGSDLGDPAIADWPAADFAPGLTAGEFRRLTEEQFARQHVLPSLAGELATRPDRLAIVMERLQRQTIFGTTFRALQEGLAIDPVAVEGRLGRPTGDSRTSWVVGGAAVPAVATGTATPPGWAGNRFCIEDETYHIVFREPGGRIEQARLPVTGNLGLFYYRHLIQDPETGYSARRLIALGREEEYTGVEDDQAGQEVGGGRTSSVQEAIDEEGLRRIKERLAEIERFRLRAEYEGNVLELQELEEEKQEIMRQLEQVYRKGRVKNIDSEAKKLQDRVRKALEDARTKLMTARRMPGLAGYLARCITYKQGSWTYRPTRGADHWLT